MALSFFAPYAQRNRTSGDNFTFTPKKNAMQRKLQ